MNLQPLDPTSYYLFLALGVVLTFAGLTLIFRKPTDENAAKLEVFGLKFQASSAGTLVLLVGVGFLLIPLFVPRAGEQAPSLASPIQSPSGPSQSGDTPLVVLPPIVDAEEVEPNDAITSPNQMVSGVKGAIDKDRDDLNDWFVLDTSGKTAQELSIRVRSSWGGCRVYAYDHREEQLGNVYCDQSGGARHLEFFNKESEQIYLRVVFNHGSAAKRAEYQLLVEQ